MAQNIKSNLIYQSLYQGTRLLIPIILVPFISRTLGTEGVGIYSFTSSIVEYFILFSGMGILLYGNREIAMIREHPKKRNQLLSELFYLKIITTLFSLVIYAVVVLLFFKHQLIYYFIQSLNIFFILFDMTWFFMGMEDFKKMSVVNILVHFFSFLLILLFVRTPNDLITYMLIKSFSESFGFFVVWLLTIKSFPLQKVRIHRLFHHFKQTLFYFIPQIGIIVYSTFNRTLLGLVSTNHNVGLYTYAMYIITAITSILTTINLVLLPRISHLFSTNKMNEIIQMVKMSVHMQLFISIPAAWGIAGIARSFVPWFFGSDFIQLQSLLPLFTPIIVLLPLGLVFSQQFLLPIGYSRQYTHSILLGAITSVALNLILIPMIGIIGAIISMLLVESFITLYQYSIVRKKAIALFNYALIFRIFLAGLGMYVLIILFNSSFPPSPITTFLQILMGVTSYFLFCLLLKIPYANYAKNYLLKHYRKLYSPSKKSL